MHGEQNMKFIRCLLMRRHNQIKVTEFTLVAPSYTTDLLEPTAWINITWFTPTLEKNFLLTNVLSRRLGHSGSQK
jgi:hypothetical protein